MKNILFFGLLLLSLSTIPACNKSGGNAANTGFGTVANDATLIKDCTGVYLRLNNKDYHVCNTEKTTALDGNIPVIATYRLISDCTGTASHAVVCMMLHQNEGWIEIEQITRK